jgi:hypothetical protein
MLPPVVVAVVPVLLLGIFLMNLGPGFVVLVAVPVLAKSARYDFSPLKLELSAPFW